VEYGHIVCPYSTATRDNIDLHPIGERQMPEEIATTTKPGMNTSFGALKQIDAGVLSVGYAHC
jgi:hypothetical protein